MTERTTERPAGLTDDTFDIYEEYGKERIRGDELFVIAADLLKACEALGAFTRELLKLVTHEQLMEAKLQRRMLKVNDQAYNAIAKARGD